MIQVNKSEPPAILVDDGASRSREDSRLFDEDQESYFGGTKRFEFDDNIYSHSTVKETLRGDQHEKCCYCEGKFEAFSHGDVEHYRPKKAVKQDKDERPLYPGYYWLAYSWENLYYCCEKCNRSFKKGLFPLEEPERRARSHNEDITAERPLIIDPGGSEDPREHIGYRKNVAYGKSEIGQKTIEIVGLNRDDLLDERLERLKLFGKLSVYPATGQRRRFGQGKCLQ